MNAGPSFNVQRPGSSYADLSGFSQRFMLRQDDPRMTPGKKEPHRPKATMKGTTKLRKSNRSVKNKRCKDVMPKGKPEPIYGGFGKSKPSKVTAKIQKSKGKKLKKQRVK